MGARKRIKAVQLKEQKSTIAIAKLNNCPISARKMRLVADIVRG
ncbi:MAG: large subunit ribosomal protein L22, partial [Arenicella sp.]